MWFGGFALVLGALILVFLICRNSDLAYCSLANWKGYEIESFEQNELTKFGALDSERAVFINKVEVRGQVERQLRAYFS